VVFDGERLEVVGEGGADATTAKLRMHLHIDPGHLALGLRAGLEDRPRHNASIDPHCEELLGLVVPVEPDRQKLGAGHRELIGAVALGLGGVADVGGREEVGAIRMVDVRRDEHSFDREIGHGGNPSPAAPRCRQPVRVPPGTRRPCRSISKC
jgi:hypothetical protein